MYIITCSSFFQLLTWLAPYTFPTSTTYIIIVNTLAAQSVAFTVKKSEISAGYYFSYSASTNNNKPLF